MKYGALVIVALLALCGVVLFGVQVDVTKPCPCCGGDGVVVKQVTCSHCGGDGKVICDVCGGDGKIAFGLLPCPNCGGSGELICSVCGGRGYQTVTETCSCCNGRGFVSYKVPLIEALMEGEL